MIQRFERLEGTSARGMGSEPVRLATTGPIDVDSGGLLTIDGGVTEVGDRILVKIRRTVPRTASAPLRRASGIVRQMPAPPVPFLGFLPPVVRDYLDVPPYVHGVIAEDNAQGGKRLVADLSCRALGGRPGTRAAGLAGRAPGLTGEA